MVASLTWNSFCSTSSMSCPLRRAERVARSNSAAESTASATRWSYLDLTIWAGFCRCAKAMASVSHRPLAPSSATCEKGEPALLLMSWTTPSSSPLRASVIGATSICLVR